MLPKSITDRNGAVYRLKVRPPVETRTYLYEIKVFNDVDEWVAVVKFGEQQPGRLNLDDIEVFRNFRGTGIGSALLEVAVSFGREIGCRLVHGIAIAYDCEVSERGKLVEWYRKRGFAVDVHAGHSREEYVGHIRKTL